MSSSIINWLFTFSSVCITIAYLCGICIFLNDYEENQCKMTYMFERPEFVQISLPVDNLYRKYGLYAYNEGYATKKTKKKLFDGIPVLFIPGNGGSHKQVRSLASIALRLAIDSKSQFHFDYFTLDLYGELSGLNGPLLFEQLQYLNHSVFGIVGLYKYRPQPIILIGHSMGGIIATRFLTTYMSDSYVVPIIVTLATPHKRPPLMLDAIMVDFYQGINVSNLSTTTLVSLSGGYNDFLIPVFQTTVGNNISLEMVTTDVPKAWLSVDHLCILWCKQTALAINRALFESVNHTNRLIKSDPEIVRKIFLHHLVKNHGGKFATESNTSHTNAGQWSKISERQYRVAWPNGVKETQFYMVELIDRPDHEMLTVIANNLKTSDWAFACSATNVHRHNIRMCDNFLQLTSLGEIVSSASHKKRILTVNLHQLLRRSDNNYTHVVFKILPTSEPVYFDSDIYSSGQRMIMVDLPKVFGRFSMEGTSKMALIYNLIVPDLKHIFQSFELNLKPIECSNEMEHATATLLVPWSNHQVHKHFTQVNSRPLKLRLYDSKPQHAGNVSAVVRLTLSPNCRYIVSIRLSISGVLANLARYYSPMLIANVAAALLTMLAVQLSNLEYLHHSDSIFRMLGTSPTPYYLLLVICLLEMTNICTFVSRTDWHISNAEGSYFVLLPLILYICSVGLVWLMIVGLFISFLLFEKTVLKIFVRMLTRTHISTSWSDYVMPVIHKVPLVVGCGLIALCWITTGGLALLLGLIYYFIKLCQHTQDTIEAIVWYYVRMLGFMLKRDHRPDPNSNVEEIKNVSVATVAVYFHTTLFFIWTLVTCINLPYVLTWANNHRYGSTLKCDPAFYPGLIMSACSIPLWQLETPKLERERYIVISRLVMILGVACLLLAPLSVYRLNYILSGCVFLVAMHQMLAGHRDVVVEQVEAIQHYEDVKTKIQ